MLKINLLENILEKGNRKGTIYMKYSLYREILRRNGNLLYYNYINSNYILGPSVIYKFIDSTESLLLFKAKSNVVEISTYYFIYARILYVLREYEQLATNICKNC